MKKLLFCFVAIFAVIGLIACVHACQTYLKASDLEFNSSVNKKPYTVELDSLSSRVPDTIVLREYLPR